ncbi:MAG TPA: hypothetical protein VD770_02145, partial [Coxiellaceae bacterium]|nr:hypothetical protein [Coxiellaceae bacterium]
MYILGELAKGTYLATADLTQVKTQAKAISHGIAKILLEKSSSQLNHPIFDVSTLNDIALEA